MIVKLPEFVLSIPDQKECHLFQFVLLKNGIKIFPNHANIFLIFSHCAYTRWRAVKKHLPED